MASLFSQEGAFQHAMNLGGGGSYSSSTKTPDFAHLMKQAQQRESVILKGYQNALRGQQRQQRQTMQGYNALQANVLGGLAGAGTARSQELADTYTMESGKAQQDLISRGLGNTTLTSSVGARYAGDHAKQQTLLANELADTNARYQSQLGLAGLDFRGQAIRSNAQLQGQSLGYQGDYQKALGDWATRGLEMQSRGRNQYGGGGGGGRGVGGGYSIGGGPRERPQEDMIANPYYQGGLAQPLAQPLVGGGGGQTTWISGYAPQGNWVGPDAESYGDSSTMYS